MKLKSLSKQLSNLSYNLLEEFYYSIHTDEKESVVHKKKWALAQRILDLEQTIQNLTIQNKAIRRKNKELWGKIK